MTDLSEPAVHLTELTPTSYAAAVLDFLTEEGFRPHLDESGDVYFKFEGLTFFVITATSEATVLTLLLPSFWPLEDAAERARAMEAAMFAHKNVRIGRVTVLDDTVVATVNAYLPEDDSFRHVLLRSLEGLKYLYLKFCESMHAQLEN